MTSTLMQPPTVSCCKLRTILPHAISHYRDGAAQQ